MRLSRDGDVLADLVDDEDDVLLAALRPDDVDHLLDALIFELEEALVLEENDLASGNSAGYISWAIFGIRPSMASGLFCTSRPGQCRAMAAATLS